MKMMKRVSELMVLSWRNPSKFKCTGHHGPAGVLLRWGMSQWPLPGTLGWWPVGPVLIFFLFFQHKRKMLLGNSCIIQNLWQNCIKILFRFFFFICLFLGVRDLLCIPGWT
jgi:hypothetical protein